MANFRFSTLIQNAAGDTLRTTSTRREEKFRSSTGSVQSVSSTLPASEQMVPSLSIYKKALCRRA